MTTKGDYGNGKFLKTIVVVCSLAVLFVSWGITIGFLFKDVETNEKTSVKALDKAEANENTLIKMEGIIGRIDENVKEIRNNILINKL